MSNSIIRFTARNKNYLWLINDNWIIPIGFSLGFFISYLIYRLIKFSYRKKYIEIENPTSGASIQDCFDADKYYELEHIPTSRSVREILKIKNEEPIINYFRSYDFNCQYC